MPYVTEQLLAEAAKGLSGRPPLAVITIPALLRAAKEQGVDAVGGDGPEFGATEEDAALSAAFGLPRPPEPQSPYRAVWDPTPDRWVKFDYAGSTLQRTRKDRTNSGVILRQTKPPTGRDRWALDPEAGAQLVSEWSASKSPDVSKVNLIDLAIWYGREQDVADLDALLEWFKSEYNIACGDLLGTIYIDGVPASHAPYRLSAGPLTDVDYESFGSRPAAPRLPGTVKDLIDQLETRLKSSHFQSPPGLTARVVSAWMRGDIVVLVGQPGTGKTMFATEVTSALAEELGLSDPMLLPVREDFDETEMIGYEKLNGEPLYRDFAENVVLTERPLQPHIVVLEEFNLAVVERYLSSVLIASQEKNRRMRLPGGVERQLPVDTFIIATCNSFRDEPETRARLSTPMKRRSTIITMPNVLATEVMSLPAGTADPDFPALISNNLIAQIALEERKVAERIAAGQGTTFDSARSAALGSVTSASDISPKALDLLCGVARAVLDTPEGRSWFTLALLRDMSTTLAMSPRDEASELDAIMTSVIDKVVHQMRGPHANADLLLAALVGAPRFDELSDLVEQMKSGGAPAELLPLL